jgi:hypothetical protein
VAREAGRKEAFAAVEDEIKRAMPSEVDSFPRKSREFLEGFLGVVLVNARRALAAAPRPSEAPTRRTNDSPCHCGKRWLGVFLHEEVRSKVDPDGAIHGAVCCKPAPARPSEAPAPEREP